MSETAVVFGEHRSLVGVLTEPTASTGVHVAAVVFNAGFLHRVGPNRVAVQIARSLATTGLAVLRFDFSGLGDSGDSGELASFGEQSVAEAREAFDFLQRRLGCTRFLVIGICSGAQVGLALAASDDRVVAAVSVNGMFSGVEVTEEMVEEMQVRVNARYHKSRLFSGQSWKRLLTGRSNYGAIARTIVRTVTAPLAALRTRRWPIDSKPEPTPSPVVEGFAALGARGVKVLLIFSDGSIAWDLLQTSLGGASRDLGALPNVDMELFERCDHVFTPRWAQERLVGSMRAWTVQHALWELPRAEEDADAGGGEASAEPAPGSEATSD